MRTVACGSVGDRARPRERACDCSLSARDCARSIRALGTRNTCDSALFGVTVYGHCSRTLFMDTVKKKKKKRTPGNWGVTYIPQCEVNTWESPHFPKEPKPSVLILQGTSFHILICFIFQ